MKSYKHSLANIALLNGCQIKDQAEDQVFERLSEKLFNLPYDKLLRLCLVLGRIFAVIMLVMFGFSIWQIHTINYYRRWNVELAEPESIKQAKIRFGTYENKWVKYSKLAALGVRVSETPGGFKFSPRIWRTRARLAFEDCEKYRKVLNEYSQRELNFRGSLKLPDLK